MVWFFILVLVGELLSRTLFRKEKQLRKKRKTEEIFETDDDVQWNMYIYFVLFILIGYPLLSIPRYFAGTPLKALLAGYALLIIVFGIFGVLIRIYIGNKKPKLGFTLKTALILLAIIGAGILSYAFSMMMD
jgi:VIT1/CCC1 family predicted Fe2+/Mn2+ transporter